MWSEHANNSKPPIRWIILIKVVQGRQHLWLRAVAANLLCSSGSSLQACSGCGYFLTAGTGRRCGALSFLYFPTSFFVGFQTLGLFSDGILGVSQKEPTQIKRFIFTISASCWDWWRRGGSNFGFTLTSPPFQMFWGLKNRTWHPHGALISGLMALYHPGCLFVAELQ